MLLTVILIFAVYMVVSFSVHYYDACVLQMLSSTCLVLLSCFHLTVNLVNIGNVH